MRVGDPFYAPDLWCVAVVQAVAVGPQASATADLKAAGPGAPRSPYLAGEAEGFGAALMSQPPRSTSSPVDRAIFKPNQEPR